MHLLFSGVVPFLAGLSFKVSDAAISKSLRYASKLIVRVDPKHISHHFLQTKVPSEVSS